MKDFQNNSCIIGDMFKDHLQKKDAELVAEALKDAEAFGPIVERYEEKLLRYVRRFTGLSKQCCEDVVQEGFLKIYRNLNGFNPEMQFSSWAYRIAHNEAINYLRKNKQNVAPLETDDEEMGDLLDVLHADVDIVKDASKGELRKAVQEVLYEMPVKYREVLVLRYLEDLDYTSMGDVLKKSVGTIGTLLNRAKERFKRTAQKKNYSFFHFE